jgi:hypothetical protein
MPGAAEGFSASLLIETSSAFRGGSGTFMVTVHIYSKVRATHEKNGRCALKNTRFF